MKLRIKSFMFMSDDSMGDLPIDLVGTGLGDCLKILPVDSTARFDFVTCDGSVFFFSAIDGVCCFPMADILSIDFVDDGIKSGRILILDL